jgi:hypothetical protein
MITQDDAERTVARWATNRSRGLGYELTPMVHEFDLGFVIWTRQPEGVMVEPGSGSCTVMDRETGEMTHYPALATHQVVEMCAAHRAGQPRSVSTLDRIAELRRQNERGVTPTVAAHLTLASDGRLRRAFGAKADGEINHHRLVREWLDAQPRGHLVRGAERHAELIVVSDTLHELDAIAALESRPPIDLDTARRIFKRPNVEAFHVRDTGDKNGGTRAIACATCALGYEHVGLFPPGFATELRHKTQVKISELPPPDPDRFPPDVTPFVVEAGWTRAGLNPPGLAAAMMSFVLDYPGLEAAHHPLTSAFEALTRYRRLLFRTHRPGVDHRVVPFDIDPTYEAASAKALADFGGLIGMPLFPIGRDTDQAILAIDESGRVFALDQGGEWYLGDTIEAALVNLIRGTGQHRVENDGTW